MHSMSLPTSAKWMCQRGCLQILPSLYRQADEDLLLQSSERSKGREAEVNDNDYPKGGPVFSVRPLGLWKIVEIPDASSILPFAVACFVFPFVSNVQAAF